ncbi:hypothetical protein DFP72DRAFT_1045478 [Ephemerocybe angulata]|uniref:Uncharacterized protein n=1 Tax=Ephemerocybe angulata TaxID=980116 RepID=A0A8H6HY86_9AGAR|nr:hypothetical protein DFP72DRAFT_1045478 [Tulosesus angulatus]
MAPLISSFPLLPSHHSYPAVATHAASSMSASCAGAGALTPIPPSPPPSLAVPAAAPVTPAPSPPKKISFTRFTLAFTFLPSLSLPFLPSFSPRAASFRPWSYRPTLPMHAHRAHKHSTHHASFQNLKPIFKAPPKPAPPPAKHKRFAPSPLSRYVSLSPPPPHSESDSEDDDSEDDDNTRGGYAHMMGPCLVGSFRPPPPKPRYHGHSRSSFGLTKWVWLTRQALCEGSAPSSPSPPSPDSPVSPASPSSPSPDSPVSSTSPSTPVSPVSPVHRRRLFRLILQSLQSPLFLRRHRRRRRLRCLRRARGEGGLIEAPAVAERSTIAEAESTNASESASESEMEGEDGEDEETLVDSDSEWDSVSTTCSSRQDSGEASDAQLSTEKGNLIEMAVGRVNSAGKGGDERKGGDEEEVDVETRHMASAAWLCAFYRATTVTPRTPRPRSSSSGGVRGRAQAHHSHSQMQWQSRWIVLLEIARRDGVRIKVVKPVVAAGGSKVGRDVRWLKLLGKSKAGVVRGRRWGRVWGRVWGRRLGRRWRLLSGEYGRLGLRGGVIIIGTLDDSFFIVLLPCSVRLVGARRWTVLFRKSTCFILAPGTLKVVHFRFNVDLCGIRSRPPCAVVQAKVRVHPNNPSFCNVVAIINDDTKTLPGLPTAHYPGANNSGLMTELLNCQRSLEVLDAKVMVDEVENDEGNLVVGPVGGRGSRVTSDAVRAWQQHGRAQVPTCPTLILIS